MTDRQAWVVAGIAGFVAAIDAAVLVTLRILEVHVPAPVDLILIAVLAVAVAMATAFEIRRREIDDEATDDLVLAAEWLDSLSASLIEIKDHDQVAAADAVSEAASRLLQKIELAKSPAYPEIDSSNLLDSRITPPRPNPIVPVLTRSAIFDGTFDPMASQDGLSGIESGDMIGRLEPRNLHWIESSFAEQAFLGWTLAQLRSMSFLDVVHPDHRELAREQLMAAIAKGEAHGLVYRIRTARGENKAVEVNVGVRYAVGGAADHLRCHITDVTDRLRASRELRRRTRDLLAANGQLILANRELSHLKDRYSDLYQNAPTMYFSLDESGAFHECNDTMLATLGYARSDLIGLPYISILTEGRKPYFGANFAKFLSTGRVEVESRWVKKSGESIDVHVIATATFGPTGEILHSRSVAQDITERKALEIQVQEKNASLARAVEDLAKKNKELDDFTYSVSHDLQEPLRTLTAFSTLLLEGQGDQLDSEGREQLGYVIDASKRMRALIADLLTLSKAGKAAGPFGPIDLSEVMAQVRADLSATIADRKAVVNTVEPLPSAWGDRDRIARLLANLVGNGLKYTRVGETPEVTVSAVADESGKVTIDVKDHGIGIDKKYHERIFGLFRRLHAHGEYEGTGAGLAICRKIVEAHGGTISVESEIGRGATFRVVLPGPGRAAG